MIGNCWHLPDSPELDIAALSRIFDKVTNSYKYLFFLSLLDILKRRQFDVEAPITFREIIIEMLANAWYPYTYFKLSFGTQDQIAKKLDRLDLVISEPILKFTDTDKKLLRETISSQDLSETIRFFKRYVPFRLLSPFLDSKLRKAGVDKGKGSDLEYAIPAIAANSFDTDKPLYCFALADGTNTKSLEYKDCHALFVHPAWVKYLETNYAIVRGWSSWHWLNYMQQKNPNTPAIVNKIFTPQKRDSLNHQTKYWNLVLDTQSIECIYSKQRINRDRFALDHYLPWSFVAHDRLWNLIPVLPKVNSSKSNCLPSQQYLDDFVRVQHLGLRISYQKLPEAKWLRKVESYINDLGIGKEDLLDWEKLRKAYHATMQPLIVLAENQGFSSNWSYNQRRTNNV
jgi:hypothetical protein